MNDKYSIKVLDHGLVTLRNVSGPTRRSYDKVVLDPQGDGAVALHASVPRDFDADDTDPANSARMSFDQTDSGRTREADLKLADYLIRNRHNTPIEMVEIWLEMKLPIFVARQFVRHRTVTINEVSGRYVQLPAEWYIPEVVGGKPVGGAKQGQSDTLSVDTQDWFKKELDHACRASYEKYELALSNGVAAEHARMFLHVNHYTHWMWKQDLHNMMNFLSLRDHSHAQIEAQMYAKAVKALLYRALPDLMALYDKYRAE